MYDPRIEAKAQLIVYHIETKHSLQLNDGAKHDVFHTVRHVADYWKRDSDRLRAEAGIRNFNELRIWCRKHQPDNAPLIKAFEKLMSGGSIR